MKYFAKITSQGYSAKNKLQEAAKLLMKDRDQLLIDEADLEAWLTDLESRIKALNEYFKRCTDLSYSRNKSHISDCKDLTFDCNEVFTITLYEVKNS